MFYLRDGGYKFTGEGDVKDVFAFDNHEGCVIYFDSAKEWIYTDHLDLYWEGAVIATIGLSSVRKSNLITLDELGVLEEAEGD